MEQPVALITGASQGLGRALATELAGRGWALVIDARRPDRLEATKQELAVKTTVVAIAGDVTDPEHRARLVKEVEALGRLDLLVNNASTLGASPLPELATIEPDVLRRTYDVNVVAPLALTQPLLPLLTERHGTVVSITSDAGVEPYPTWGGYGSSKAAFEHLSAVLGVEQPGIRVLVVDPGDLRTEMHQDAFPGEDISDRPPPDASAAAVVALVARGATSGRYRTAAVEVS